MVDTIAVRLDVPVVARYVPGWEVCWRDVRSKNDEHPDSVNESVVARCSATGMRAVGAAGFFRSVEFSLPRAVANTNAQLPQTVAEFDAALNQAKCHTVGLLGGELRGVITRLDLARDFAGSTQQWIAAFRNSSHPKIRGKRVLFGRETLYLKGAERQLCIYDKGKQQGAVPDVTVRVEWSLRRRRVITHEFGHEITIHNLAFAECYRVYRRLCMPLSAAPVDYPVKRLTAAEVLCAAEKLGYREMVDAQLGRLSQRARKRMLKMMAACSNGSFHPRFAELLPENG